MTSRLHSRHGEHVANEQSRAIRALLAQPLLTVENDPVAFDLVRRHASALRAWFEQTCGWALHVEPRRGYARLQKVSASPDPTRPARRRRSTRSPLDRRRYTMLCLVCAELARPGAMTTIGLLADRVRASSATDDAVQTFDTANREQRAAFVDALKLLEHYGVVRPLDGATDAFLDSADAKVLYQVDQTRLARLLSAPVGPSQVTDPGVPGDRIAALVRERRYGDAPAGRSAVPEDQRNRWLRHTLSRRLLDDPVVYRAELDEAQRSYLATPTGRRVIREAAEAAGFEVEERAEGLLAVDPDGVATDTRFPDEQHAKHAALLLLDALPVGRPVPLAALTAGVERLLARFPSWAKAYRSAGGAARLASDAVDVLRGFGLVRREGETVTAQPAAARYAAQAPITEDTP
jgi:uncharacterized protein (TIGR02678 family)